MSTTALYGLDRRQLAHALATHGLPGYVPKQLFRWFYGRRETDFTKMTDLKLSVRELLSASFVATSPQPSETSRASDDTIRYAFVLDDGSRVESVWIPGDEGQATMCLSSQVGCPLACSFCVSGLEGLKRNLTTAEIVGQARAMLPTDDALRRTNIVFMGMGEALLNLDNVVRAVAILADSDGFDIAPRRMTVSTAGHVPALAELARVARRPRLAISLNATTDALRDELMPINRKWPLAALLDACRRFPLQRGERITFEYVLLGGVNDSVDDARRIPRLLAGIPAKVNLIPWNPAPGFPYVRPDAATVTTFAELLRRKNMVTTVRRQRGGEADAACGQLAVRRA